MLLSGCSSVKEPMKHVYLWLAALVIVQVSVSAQPAFQLLYSSPYENKGKCVIQTFDRNYVIGGYSFGFGSSGNAMLVKVDSVGDIVWARDYSGINFEVINDIRELPDKSLVMCGATASYGAGSADGFVMRTDSLGNLIWAKAIGGYNLENFCQLTPDRSNGVYVAGYSISSTLASVLVTRVDPNGNVLWIKEVSSWAENNPPDFPGLSIASRIGGGVLLATAQFPNDNFAVYRFTEAGNLVWSKGFIPVPAQSGIWGLSVEEADNRDILVNYAVSNTNTVAQSYDNMLARLDTSGTPLWVKSYGGTYTDICSKILPTKQGDVILLGGTNSAGNGDWDASLIRIGPSGNVKWARAYGSLWADYGYNGQQTFDEGFIFAGLTFPQGTTIDTSKFYLVKTDSVGESTCNAIPWTPLVNDQTLNSINHAAPTAPTFTPVVTSFVWNSSFRDLQIRSYCNDQLFSLPDDADETNGMVYPNPFSDAAMVRCSSCNEQSSAFLYDVWGKEVMPVYGAGEVFTIYRNGLPAGVYILRLFTPGEAPVATRIIVTE